MSKLLSQGSYGCIYYPGMKCDGRTDRNKQYVTKLQKLDHSADTEIFISNKIKQIKNYSKYFLPVEKYCNISLSKLDSKTLEPCEIIARYTTNDYILMYIKYVKSKPFMEFILGNIVNNHKSKITKVQYKQQIYRTIITYKRIMKSLAKLNNKNIVHFDLHANNIICSEKTGRPYIIDFGMSFILSEITVHNIRNTFFSPAPEYYIYPLEVHFINMIISQDAHNINLTDIHTLCNTYVSKNKALKIFSKEFKILYYKSCIDYLRQYIGKDRIKIAFKLLEYSISWNNYSLSIINLQLLYYLFHSKSNSILHNKIIIKFSQLLLQNIHPNPKKRYTIKKTHEIFNSIFINNPKADYNNMFKSSTK